MHEKVQAPRSHSGHACGGVTHIWQLGPHEVKSSRTQTF